MQYTCNKCVRVVDIDGRPKHAVILSVFIFQRIRTRKLDRSVNCCFCNFLFILSSFCHISLATPCTDQFVYVTVSWFHGIFPVFMLPQHNQTWDHLHTRARLLCSLASVSGLRSSVSGHVTRYRLNRFILKLAPIGNDLASFRLYHICIRMWFVISQTIDLSVCVCLFRMTMFCRWSWI